MLKDFKEFAMKGNVVDMAVGVIIGGAFGKIVNSLVNDIIMPPLGVLLSNMDFSHMAVVLREQSGETPAVTLKYGMFLNTVLDFLIVAFVIFLVVRQMIRFKKAEKPAPTAAPTTKECPKCLSQIPLKATRCAHCAADL